MWTVVLEEISEFVGGRAAALVFKDSGSAFVEARYQFGIDPNRVRLYSETYSKFDPFAALAFVGGGQIVSLPDLVCFEEYCKGRFYQEWAVPQGWIDVASAVLDKSATSYVFLSVFRGIADGMVDDEMRRRMSLVIPHVRRAALIGKVISLKREEAQTFADTFDGLGAGMFLVDGRGQIIHANSAGSAILSEGSVLRSMNGQLVAGEAQINKTLRDKFAMVDQGDAALGTKGLALPLRAPDGERYVVHVLPLASEARLRAGVAHTAIAAVFVRKAILETRSAPEVIGLTYKLTPTELRVLLAVVEVGGVPEVAAALGVAQTTIKTHVSRLFEKTGTSRQADLVKLVAGFSTPLAD
ncbi:DNA-binding CsgD family transcriptional regulator/PAS domain-containing protein [Bradyrhizobium sp. AZCC 1678]|uniref:helix-turn-helix transcriptional regulator n=1 Tax=Bradyrhizobium sp. AZCC 1678 TaxID=3117030 RepID=UPI002FEF0B15